jgi:hypothetical protein
LRIKHCEFGNATVEGDRNNADRLGGALFGESLNGEIVNATFLGNLANVSGGAVYLWKMGTKSRLDFTNCAFWRNFTTGLGGGAVFLGGTAVPQEGANAKFVNCTFAQNYTGTCADGTAVNVSANAIGMIYNSILWHNYAYFQPVCGITSNPIVGSATVEYSDVQYGWPNQAMSNIDSDPNFINFNPLFDLRLSSLSDCLEVADYSRLPFDTLDVNGNGILNELLPIDLARGARYVDDPAPNLPVVNTYLDMGAYERQ